MAIKQKNLDKVAMALLLGGELPEHKVPKHREK